MKYFVGATRMVSIGRADMQISALKKNMQMLSLPDADCYLHWYLVLELAQWPGWPAGDPQHNRNTGTCIRGHGWMFFFRIGSHMHFLYPCKLHTGRDVTQT